MDFHSWFSGTLSESPLVCHTQEIFNTRMLFSFTRHDNFNTEYMFISQIFRPDTKVLDAVKEAPGNTKFITPFLSYKLTHETLNYLATVACWVVISRLVRLSTVIETESERESRSEGIVKRGQGGGNVACVF